MSTNQSYNEKELFVRISKGDREAYSALFMEYYGRVYTKALIMCKVEAAADDVAQQVFLKLWEHRASLAEVPNPQAWLLTLTKNQVLDMLKHQAHSKTYLNYIKELAEDFYQSPEQSLISRQRRDLLDSSINSLTAKQREVYQLSRKEGLAYQEIASELGISKETVKEHMKNALAGIRDFLQRHRDELLLLFLLYNYFS